MGKSFVDLLKLADQVNFVWDSAAEESFREFNANSEKHKVRA